MGYRKTLHGKPAVTHTPLDELSEQAEQFVRAAALVGETFALQDVAWLQSATTLSLLPSLDEVVATGLIRFDGDHLAFCSPQVCRSLNAEVAAPVRRVLLRGVAVPPQPYAAPTASSATATDDVDDAGQTINTFFLTTDSLSVSPAHHTKAELRRHLVRDLTPIVGAAGAETEAERVLGLFDDDGPRQRDRARVILKAQVHGPATVVAALVLSNSEWTAGQLDEGLQWGHEAMRIVDNLLLPVAWRPYPALALAIKLIQLGQWSNGTTVLTQARELAERLGQYRAVADSTVVLGRLLLSTGRTAQAEAELTAGVALAHRNHSGMTAAQGLSLLSLMTLARGEIEDAADQVWRARTELTRERCAFSAVRQRWAEFLVATARTDPRGAVDLLMNRYPDLVIKPSLFIRDHSAAPRVVRLALSAGETSLAAAVVGQVEQLGEQSSAGPGLLAAAKHAWGLLHDDAEALEYAACEHQCRWAAAAASEDLGMLFLRRQGRNGTTAQRYLRTALERYRAVDAHRAAARVKLLVCDLDNGCSQHAAAPSLSALQSSSALTEGEARIARLVAEGLTNKQVAKRVSLSPHTVNYHLRQIFRKLQVSSRVELARRLV